MEVVLILPNKFMESKNLGVKEGFKTNLSLVTEPKTFAVFSTLPEKGLSSLTSSRVEHIVSTPALAGFF